MIYIGNGMYSDSGEYLQHYGVLGMKWGQHLFGRARDAYGSARNLYRKGLRRTLNGTRTGRAAQRVGKGLKNVNYGNVAKEAARYTFAPLSTGIPKAARIARSKNTPTNRAATVYGRAAKSVGRGIRKATKNSLTARAAQRVGKGLKNVNYGNVAKEAARYTFAPLSTGIPKAARIARSKNTPTNRAATVYGRAAKSVGRGIRKATKNSRMGRATTAARSAGKNIRKRVRRL